MPRLAAFFFQQQYAFDAHAAIHRLAHVVDGEQRDRHARQRGIVSRSFTPRQLASVLDSVETIF